MVIPCQVIIYLATLPLPLPPLPPCGVNKGQLTSTSRTSPAHLGGWLPWLRSGGGTVCIHYGRHVQRAVGSGGLQPVGEGGSAHLEPLARLSPRRDTCSVAKEEFVIY